MRTHQLNRSISDHRKRDAFLEFMGEVLILATFALVIATITSAVLRSSAEQAGSSTCEVVADR